MSPTNTSVGRFAARHAVAITFITMTLCLAGVFAALHMSSAVFPVTAFPRIVVSVSNGFGFTPAKQMMPTVTRRIEYAMKSIPGVRSIRSTTTRGSAIVNVLFNWHTDMHRSELYVLARVAEIRNKLPPGMVTHVERTGFTLSYPIMGISLTSSSPDRTSMDLWNTATYTIKPLFLQIPGVSNVDIIGGKRPEYHVVVAPAKLLAARLSLNDVTKALKQSNLVASAGLMAQNYRLFLTTVDGRVYSPAAIGKLVIAVHGGHPIRVRDVAQVVRAPAPTYTRVTAQGQQAVLLDVEAHSYASILTIAAKLKSDLAQLHQQLPPDMHLEFYYDQSSFVRESVSNVWDAIVFGLILSVVILYFFLKDWGSVLTAVITIPVSVLVTFVVMKVAGMSLNMMTLGGIAASIGLIIDNAIIVVEAMSHQLASGQARLAGIQNAMGEILTALIASTLTPVVVFLPLAYLNGLTGVFFRALAIAMIVALLASLLLALTLTPSLASWFIRSRARTQEYGRVLRPILRIYGGALRWTLKHWRVTLLGCVLVLVGSFFVYRNLQTSFLPYFDEGGFDIDFTAQPGTTLAETGRVLDQAERIIRNDPDVQSYSRRLGTQLGPYLIQPYVGSYLIKLKADRKHTTRQVMAYIRHQFDRRFPTVTWDIHGFLDDLIGDLQLAPFPVEVRLYSPNLAWLKKTAPRVQAQLQQIPHLVDTYDGLRASGPTIKLRVRPADAERFGLTTQTIADAAHNALIGKIASYVVKGQRVVNIRVIADPARVDRLTTLRELPIRTPTGAVVRLDQVATVTEQPAKLELHRNDLRQVDTVDARLEGIDLGTAMREVKAKLSQDKWLPPGTVQYAGLYRLQQKSFRTLLFVLLTAILLVFIVLVVEFRSFYEPIAIVFGAVLGLFGAMFGLWVSGITLNIVSYLGAIIGVGIVAKNGILVLDYFRQLQAQGMELVEALVQAGQRRLRPVLMTSLAAGLGMLPLAYGGGAGAQMLQPLGITVIGSVGFSVLLSLIATPVVYYVLIKMHLRLRGGRPETTVNQ